MYIPLDSSVVLHFWAIFTGLHHLPSGSAAAVAKNATVVAYGFPGGAGEMATARRLSYCHFADKGEGGAAGVENTGSGEQYRQKLQLIRLLLVRNRLQFERATDMAALKSIIKTPSTDQPPNIQPSNQKSPLQACLLPVDSILVC